MANGEITEASGEVELENRQTPAQVQTDQAHVLEQEKARILEEEKARILEQVKARILEQAKAGILDLSQTELGSGNISLDFKGGPDHRTPLHLAAMEGHDEIVEFILSHKKISKGVVNAKDRFGYTPLHLAVRESKENVVKLLTTSSLVLPDRFLAATSERDDLDRDCGGYTPLHWAAVKGDKAIAELLVRQPCPEESTYKPVNISAMTWRNLTTVDLARQNSFRDLGNFLEASDLKWLQQEITRTTTSANAVLVGAAMVAAAAFSVWLHPIAMLEPESDMTGLIILFYWCIAPACFFSLGSVQFGILATFRNPWLSLGSELAVRREAFNVARGFLQMAIFMFLLAFCFASVLVFDNGVLGWMISAVAFSYAFITEFEFFRFIKSTGLHRVFF